MERDYTIPVGFVKYNYVSQLLQARGMQIAIEAHRRSKPYNMGTLYWQLNDCWPVVSWSSIDYSGNWKAFHYQAKRSFEPVIISVAENNKSYEIYVISDWLKEIKADVKLELIDFEGKPLWKSNVIRNLKADISENILSINKSDWAKFDVSKVVLKNKFRK